jgi:hypothetical protein
LKDFTTVLSMKRDKRKEILAQLREIFDGSLTKVWGTSKKFEWSGRLTVIAGVTYEIDRHYEVMSALGQRFLLLRIGQPDRVEAALHAIDVNKESEELRKELQGLVGQFFERLSIAGDGPALPERYKQQLARIADFSTRARTPVVRGFSRQFEYAPEDPEGPGRFVKQLCGLAAGLALIDGRNEVSDADIALVTRVAIDSLPTIRRVVVLDLLACDAATLNDLAARHPHISKSTIARALEDLQALSVVIAREADKENEPSFWSLSARDKRVLLACRVSANGTPRAA